MIQNIDKIMISILSIMLLTACGGNKAEVIDEKEIARIQEIDRMRGKALTKKVLAEREQEKKLAQLEKEKQEKLKKEQEKIEQDEREKKLREQELMRHSESSQQAVVSESPTEIPNQQQEPSKQSDNTNQFLYEPGTVIQLEISEPNLNRSPDAIRLGDIANSGREFDTMDEANSWAASIFKDLKQWELWEEKLNTELNGYYVFPIYWNDDSFTYTIEFY